jgi:acylpyruvate hydrolase
MKLASFRLNGQVRLGVVTADGLIDLNAAQPQVPADLGAALWQGVDLQAAADAAIASDAQRIPLADISYAAPVTRPGKIICLGLNYFDHAKEGGVTNPTTPGFSFAVRPR